MEDNKYYKPDLEDLFVGYECERRFTESLPWEKEVLDSLYTDRDGWGAYEYEVAIKHNNIRTHYLTPEQIKNEGWEYIAMIMLVNNNIIFKKGKSQLRYDPIEHTGEITTEIEGKDFIKLTKTLYNGKIKSINELRKIEKLLGI